MPKKILVDLNIILDVFLERDGFEASRDVLLLGEQHKLTLFAAAHSITTLAYLLEHAKVPQSTIRQHIAWVLDTCKVIPATEQMLRSALESKMQDYEDAVIDQSAVNCGAGVIITRNTKDFKVAVTAAFTPEQFLRSK